MTRTAVSRARARYAMQLFLFLLPWSMRRQALSRLFYWHLHPTSRIGLSFVDAAEVVLSEGARIGHLTVVRDLRRLDMGKGSLIGNWNWITAARVLRRSAPTAGTLRIGSESAITSRHYIDCSGWVEIGDLVTIAGVRSTIITHQINREQGIQSTSLVRIGDRCLISSNVKFAPGSSVAEDSVVGMGAVVVGQLVEPNQLYAGVPARSVKALGDADAYLSRSRARVGLPGDVSRPSGGA